MMSPRERAWAEALFAAILGPTEAHGMPSFESLDLASFYGAIEHAPGPAFAPGLRERGARARSAWARRGRARGGPRGAAGVLRLERPRVDGSALSRDGHFD